MEKLELIKHGNPITIASIDNVGGSENVIIGDYQRNLILRSRGTVRIQINNKFYDLLANEESSIIGAKGTIYVNNINDQFYSNGDLIVELATGDLYTYYNNELINLTGTNTVNDTFLSYINNQVLTPVQSIRALTNIGYYWDNISQKSFYENQLVYNTALRKHQLYLNNTFRDIYLNLETGGIVQGKVQINDSLILDGFNQNQIQKNTENYKGIVINNGQNSLSGYMLYTQEYNNIIQTFDGKPLKIRLSDNSNLLTKDLVRFSYDGMIVGDGNEKPNQNLVVYGNTNLDALNITNIISSENYNSTLPAYETGIGFQIRTGLNESNNTIWQLDIDRINEKQPTAKNDVTNIYLQTFIKEGYGIDYYDGFTIQFINDTGLTTGDLLIGASYDWHGNIDSYIFIQLTGYDAEEDPSDVNKTWDINVIGENSTKPFYKVIKIGNISNNVNNLLIDNVKDNIKIVGNINSIASIFPNGIPALDEDVTNEKSKPIYSNIQSALGNLNEVVDSELNLNNNQEFGLYSNNAYIKGRADLTYLRLGEELLWQDNVLIINDLEILKSRTITGANGLVGGGNLFAGNIVISHANGSWTAKTSLTGGTVISNLSVDTYGHLTNWTTRTLTTTDIAEGNGLYFNEARVRATPLTGLSITPNSAIVATDTVLQAFGKLQAQMNSKIINNGSLTLSTANGLSGSATFTANQSGNSTFTVTPVYGTAANTIAQGNDSRIINGQTAFGWGNHAGRYVSLTDSETVSGIKTFSSQIRIGAGTASPHGVKLTSQPGFNNTTIIETGWDNTNGDWLDLSPPTNNAEVFKLRVWRNGNVTVNGALTVNSLSGSGNRMVVAIPNGTLTTQAIPVNTTYSAGNGLTLSGTTFSLPVTQSGSGNGVASVTQTTNGITVLNADFVTTTSNQTGIGGNKSWTGTQTWNHIVSEPTPTVHGIRLWGNSSGAIFNGADASGGHAFILRTYNTDNLNSMNGIQASFHTGGVQAVSTGGSWLQGRDLASYSAVNHGAGGSYYPLINLKHASSTVNRTYSIGSLGGTSSQFGIFMYHNDRTVNGTDASFYMNHDGNMVHARASGEALLETDIISVKGGGNNVFTDRGQIALKRVSGDSPFISFHNTVGQRMAYVQGNNDYLNLQSWGLGVRILNLSGGGNQMVVANNDGLLGVQAIPVNTTYTAGTGLTLSGTTFGQTITQSGSGNGVASITQNANGFAVANADFALSARTITAGNGLTGGGNLTANRSLAVGAGDGINVTATAVAVDNTVVRTTGAQSIAGVKSFSNSISVAETIDTKAINYLPYNLGTSTTVIWSNGNKQFTSLSSNRTYNVSNLPQGSEIQIEIINTSSSQVTIGFTGGTLPQNINGSIPAGRTAVFSMAAFSPGNPIRITKVIF